MESQFFRVYLFFLFFLLYIFSSILFRSLQSFFPCLFFLFIGIYALRGAIDDIELRGRASALVAIVGTINIPIIKYSVDWWHTLHQGDTFSLTEKPAMPPEMWLPLLFMAIAMYCFAGYAVLSRMRTEVLLRERNTQWVRELVR